MRFLIAKIFQYALEALLAMVFIFFFLEYFRIGFVTNYLNFNLLLLITLFSGIVYLSLLNKEAEAWSKKRIFFPIIVGISGWVITATVLPQTHKVYYLIPFIIGLSLFLGFRLLSNR